MGPGGLQLMTPFEILSFVTRIPMRGGEGEDIGGVCVRCVVYRY